MPLATQVVSANQNKARFFEISRDRDLKSDRPAIVFAHAPPAFGRRGSVMHTGTGGERRSRQIVAGPSFLGLLRSALSLRSNEWWWQRFRRMY